MLKLYDSAARAVRDFVPIDPANVRMYVCGPTVYDHAHIGNARPAAVFDLLFRLLRHLYGAPHVRYARNITDVDDKIIVRAAENGEPITALTERMTQAYIDMCATIGLLPPTHTPRATEAIGSMLDVIERLLHAGRAYVAEGHVLFNVGSYADYGRLSRRDPDELLAGARVDVAPYKRDPHDFVLWKPTHVDHPGWDSPWGRGRPGWHIECSAMARDCLGTHFDIHGGGVDLIFPHHENEAAQSCCAFQTPFVNYWLHNGFLQVEGRKMSKSLGNFLTVHDLLHTQNLPGDVIRMTLLRTHYRQPSDWTQSAVRESATVLRQLYRAAEGDDSTTPDPAFIEALCDDLNFPAAAAVLHALPRPAGTLRFLGFLGFETKSHDGDASAEAEALLQQRNAARARRDFAEADRLRAELATAGYDIEDTPTGSVLRRRGC